MDEAQSIETHVFLVVVKALKQAKLQKGLTYQKASIMALILKYQRRETQVTGVQQVI